MLARGKTYSKKTIDHIIPIMWGSVKCKIDDKLISNFYQFRGGKRTYKSSAEDYLGHQNHV